MLGFSKGDGYTSRVHLFIDNTIVHILTELQVSNLGGEQAVVKVRSADDT